MGLKDMITKARTSATGALTRHRRKIDQGIDKVGEVADTKTGGRYETRMCKGSYQARAGLDKVTRTDGLRKDQAPTVQSLPVLAETAPGGSASVQPAAIQFPRRG